jgi:hypothetical protein
VVVKGIIQSSTEVLKLFSSKDWGCGSMVECLPSIGEVWALCGKRQRKAFSPSEGHTYLL